MTPEQRECYEAVKDGIWFRPDRTLPPGAPDARRLNEWEAKGWIRIIDEPPRQRWALTPDALARWS